MAKKKMRKNELSNGCNDKWSIASPMAQKDARPRRPAYTSIFRFSILGFPLPLRSVV